MADVPRVECSEHGVVTVAVPWSEPGSGFTALFEALVIDWLGEGREDLKHSKHRWLMNPQNMSRKQWRGFKTLRESTLKTARAWAIKELAMSLWGYTSRTWAMKAWKQ